MLYCPSMLNGQREAEIWNNPDGLIVVEQGRIPVHRALGKIVADTFARQIPLGGGIFEVGAGTGYLKDLVPPEYHADYTSSDYNEANLHEGLKRRDLKTQVASAYDLPLDDDSVDCVVDMDAYDTLPDLPTAMSQVQRVLKPGGSYVHFQVNVPSDDMLMFDYPDHIFFLGGVNGRQSITGVKREDLEQGLEHIQIPEYRQLLAQYLKDPEGMYVAMLTSPQLDKMTRLIGQLLAAVPVDKMAIPSLPDYFKAKLEREAACAGLTVQESLFRETSFIGKRNPVHTMQPDRNSFSLRNGNYVVGTNPLLAMDGSDNVIEQASALVFVAKKCV